MPPPLESVSFHNSEKGLWHCCLVCTDSLSLWEHVFLFIFFSPLAEAAVASESPLFRTVLPSSFPSLRRPHFTHTVFSSVAVSTN